MANFNPRPVPLDPVSAPASPNTRFRAMPISGVEPGEGGSGAVDSVNGEIGVVVLDAAAVGALPDTWQPTVADIDATGSATTATYLRGDGTWATPESAVTSVNGESGSVTLTATDVGAHPNTWEPAVGNIDAAGTPGVSNFLRGDGTWATPPDQLPAQTDQEGKLLTTDGTDPAWTTITIPPSVAAIVYEAQTDARPSADLVLWVPASPALANPDNAAVGDLVLRSVEDAVQGLNGVTGIWQGTAAEYAAIGTPDANVLYAVTA